MSAKGRQVWRAFADEITEAAPSPAGVELWRALCETVADIAAAEAFVAETGQTITMRNDKGDVVRVVQAPRYQQLLALRRDLLKFGAQLGVAARVTAASDGGGSIVDELARRRADRVPDAAAAGDAGGGVERS